MEATSLAREEFWSLFENTPLANYTSHYGGQYKLDTTRVALIAAYCSLLLVGTCGNGWVAVVIGRLLLDEAKNGHNGNCRTVWLNGTTIRAVNRAHKTPQRPIQIYILALCCCDLIVLCFLVFLIVDLIYGRWVADSSTLLCQMYLSSESLNKFCAPFLLVFLSGYCYVRVCRNGSLRARTNSSAAAKPKPNPNLARNKSFRQRIKLDAILHRLRSPLTAVAICLILVACLVTPVYIYADVYFLILHNATSVFSVVPKCAIQPSENVLTAFTAYSFVCGYVLPASLFTFFYACILKKAWLQAKLRQRQHHHSPSSNSAGLLASNSSMGTLQRRPSKSYLSRVVKTTMGLVLFYFVCWTPYWAMSLYQYTIPHDQQGQTSHVGTVLGYLVHTLPYVNCTGYPILFTLLNKNIKESYKRINVRKEMEHSQHSCPSWRHSDNKAILTDDAQRRSC